MIFIFTKFPVKKYRRRVLALFSITLLIFLFSFSISNLKIDSKMLLSLHLISFFLLGALTSEYNVSCRQFFFSALSIFILGLSIPSVNNDLLFYPFALILGLAFILTIPKRVLGFYRWDLSYGVYIWAWPLSQATLVLSKGEMQHQLFLLFIMVEALIMATISWLTIEGPSRRFK